MSRITVSVIVPGLSLLASAAYADCGSIPFKSWAGVYEPNQRALIAFDGKEEILVLSTELKSTVPTKVLEVLPLPSEPELKPGNPEAFTRATELINLKIFGNPYHAPFGAAGGASSKNSPPAGEVTYTKQIGAHDISVTHVVDGGRFVDWAEKYLIDHGAGKAVIPAPLKQVIQEYINDGFQWFAFDVVELDEELATKSAIQYRFKTDRLYFPLRITRAEKGKTKVRLLVLTHGVVQRPDGPELKVRLVHQPINVTRIELKKIDADLFEMFRYTGGLKLRIWEVQGELSKFRRDIITR